MNLPSAVQGHGREQVFEAGTAHAVANRSYIADDAMVFEPIAIFQKGR